MRIPVDEHERLAMISNLLSRNIARFSGYDGLAAAVIQNALQDCYTHQGDYEGGTYRPPHQVRLEAARWLVTEGKFLAGLLGIQPSLFEQILELFVPPRLLSQARDESAWAEQSPLLEVV